MIRTATPDDFEAIYEIINDASSAYKGIIPEDRWHEPYMPREELRQQLEEGVVFSCSLEGDEVLGVMGIQNKGKVDLIRHAYVRTRARGGGIGGKLLAHLREQSHRPILIGTWKAATWAIGFYEKHSFVQVDEVTKTRLLRTYWTIPERQVETSVVLADERFLASGL